MLKPILIALSFLFGILSVRRLRKLDVHEPEPFWKMAAVSVWGGMASVVVALLLYRLLNATGLELLDHYPVRFVFVGLIEEAAKLIALLLSWLIIRKELNEPTDGLVYMACVALGFSLIENYLYARNSLGTSWLVAFRLIVCTPMHIAFSVPMGLALFQATRQGSGWGALGRAYLFASVYHAFYDIVISIPLLLPVFYLFVMGAYAWMFKLLGYTTACSPFRTTLKEWIEGGSPDTKDGVECLDCGCTEPKPSHELGRIEIQQCPGCGALLGTQESLCRIVHHFGSAFGDLRKVSNDWKKLRILVEPGRVDEKNGIACFRLEELHPQLEALTAKQIETMEARWWFPKKARDARRT